jgi:hypothetical protein
MNPQFWMAIALGGVFIAILGSIAEYMREKELPKAKGVVRDFLIGGILTSLIFQFVPESVTDIVNGMPTFSVPSFSGGAIEPELQVGVPKF